MEGLWLWIIGGVFALFIVLWLGRLLACWWWRMDEIVTLLTAQNATLERIVEAAERKDG